MNIYYSITAIYNLHQLFYINMIGKYIRFIHLCSQIVWHIALILKQNIRKNFKLIMHI